MPPLAGVDLPGQELLVTLVRVDKLVEMKTSDLLCDVLQYLRYVVVHAHHHELGPLSHHSSLPGRKYQELSPFVS